LFEGIHRNQGESGRQEEYRSETTGVFRMSTLKVKTFMSPLKIFHTKEEIASLDDQVNQFMAEQDVKRVISVSDACTTDNTGATIGIIRVLAYET